ncbi:hypothetical protein Rsub_01652 [Raphidocelis subcapitata]|uniref:Tyrosine-protein kinase ephrin type A/B receptor-like domain-containing protein n=1 Tax=Raphidocelis subcapitata TaxID=307507 RepID=A0A2V0NML3_9CHLO|nr:hypothetical protein Rsub_01652 [Raphidocelis subcapitata]|eukprot:GBF88751.1 hypothetical protein Rsub_01652 [Raphidocelis subcapitata]
MNRHATVLYLILLLAAPRLGEGRGLDDARRERRGDGLGGGAQRQRRLLQTADDCARSVPKCVACRYQFVQGTVSKAVCLACEQGYVVKAAGRACWCAPGYYRSSSSGECTPCGMGYWCPGAADDEASGEARYACGTNKITVTQYAKWDRECVTQPGYGWAEGNASAPCPKGTFNPGYNNRACASCAGGLTTSAPGADSPADCRAPEGSYYLRGKAIPCAQGTYKASSGNVDCSECPAGTTTAFGEVGKKAAADCTYVLPGHYAAAGQTPGEFTAPQCLANTYRSGAALYSPGTGVACMPCPDNTQTLTGVRGATSRSACLAPPGYGWNATDGTAAACDYGYFKAGWDREACTKCGEGTITTAAQASASPDACYTPAGHGNSLSADGLTLTGFACPVGTYGRELATYGLVDVECSKCIENTATNGTGSTSAAQCVTLPGFGWDNGGSQICEFAYWSAGGSQESCQYCGEGFNTTAAGGGAAARGADSGDDCAIGAGWTDDGVGSIKPCLQGSYKSLLGPSACVKCPSGTTTTLTFAPTALSDCDACRTGFGAAAISGTAPACAICESGTYSFGHTSGGQDCQPCPSPDGYSGAMVSRRGIPSPDGCYPEFGTDAATSSLPYDEIAMSDAALSEAAANGTASDCEAACAGSTGCQYFVFVDGFAAGTSCKTRELGVAAANVSAPGSYILFEIGSGVYLAYNAHSSDWASTGATIGTFTTRALAAAACDTQATCIGIVSNADGSSWRTFAGATHVGATAKVRVSGPAINPWIAEPTAS